MGTKNNPGKFDCYSRAEPDEPTFTLLGRDPIGSVLVHLWADIAERMGKDPEKVAEARQCAAHMATFSVLRKPDAIVMHHALDAMKETISELEYELQAGKL